MHITLDATTLQSKGVAIVSLPEPPKTFAAYEVLYKTSGMCYTSSYLRWLERARREDGAKESVKEAKRKAGVGRDVDCT